MIDHQPRLLSLDGGGVRGLSSLLILREIMEEIQRQSGREETPLPSQYFDLIGGTSTGGLIAIMLGRLRMVYLIRFRSCPWPVVCRRVYYKVHRVERERLQRRPSDCRYDSYRRWSMPFRRNSSRKCNQKPCWGKAWRCERPHVGSRFSRVATLPYICCCHKYGQCRRSCSFI